MLKSFLLDKGVANGSSRYIQALTTTVESLQTYHSSFCKSLKPLLDKIELENTSTWSWSKRSTMEFQIPSRINSKRHLAPLGWQPRTISESVWQNIKSYVQLAVAYALSATKSNTPRLARIPQISKMPPTQPSQTPQSTVGPPPKVLDTEQSTKRLLCANCRAGTHSTADCPRRSWS